MPRGNRPSKKDVSQPAVEAAFRSAGWSIADVHAVGNSFDMFVAKAGTTIAIECKTGKRQRKPNQVDLAETWQGLYLWGSVPLVLLERAEGMLRKEIPF